MTDTTTAGHLRDILNADHRTEEVRERDAARHPLETLTFFGLHEHMNVVEIWPFFGWYSHIIAPLVKDYGRYMAAIFPPDNKQDYMNKQRQDYIDLLNNTPEVFGKPHIGDFGNGYFNYAPDNSADMIITIRNLHNWLWDADYSGNKRPPYYKEVFESFRRILKPGGILGVEQHRGDPNKPQDPFAKMLYVRQDHAIQLLVEAGFIFLGSSEVNANPKDTRDHPEGPLSLPPFLRGVPEEDKDKYRAIGEADRMTLKFMNPV
ncbi:MAG: methyltransferase [Rhodospirillaceae bacterium]|jgi:predicted methyltransferase|nr:methyltransferase [Rhodospirillaceae bacterium]